ncbi:MAG TPA: pyridine nucleotide-disulfide oxidoreductase [Bacteroidetes bacterium]|nr:pyridine nucleotide-disulfide oxidoreductase [Bacteroidota bacterium]
MERRHSVVIVGGGTAGITVASQLKKKDRNLDVAIIEPSEDHFYQPIWTLIGGVVFDKKISKRKMVDYIPKGVTWIKDYAASFSPKENFVTTKSGDDIHYDYMVVAPGIQLDWDKVKGLPEALGKGGVCSNYGYERAEYTWEVLRNLKKGRALFTQPNTPVKCGGAPQKIMYLTADHLRLNGHLDDVDIQFMSPGETVFGVEKFRLALLKVLDRYGIKFNYRKNLVEIKGAENIAVFEVTDTYGNMELQEEHYDMIHVVPPQSAPDFVKSSGLCDEEGWVDVDNGTLQHNHFPNIFSLGDVSGTTKAKTGAAIRKQAPVVSTNLMELIRQGKITSKKVYNGYSSCPLVTGYGKLILAEFDYDNNPDPSFPFEMAKERKSMYLLKTKILPILYWSGMLKGRA